MPETDITLPVLKRARDILKQRGWQTRFSAADEGSINIRSAISIACREIAVDNHQWHVGYRSAVSTLSLFLKDGVCSWEFGTHANKPRLRKSSEVFDLFDKVIKKLESHDEKCRADTGDNNNSNIAL